MFQLVDDTLINGLCLSPNQLFWRASVAFGFGLLAGGVGLVAGAAAAGIFGVTGFALTGIAFGASFIATVALHSEKQRRINWVTGWAK